MIVRPNGIERCGRGSNNYNQCIFSTKGISHMIFRTYFMFKHKRKLLYVIKPSCMFGIQMLLRMNMPQRIMVRVQDEVLVDQVMSPMVERLDDGIKLQVIRRVSLLCFIKFLTEEGNRVPLLAQYSPYTNV